MSTEDYKVSCEGLQGKPCSAITGTVAQWSDDGKMASGLKQLIDTFISEMNQRKREGTINGIGIGVFGTALFFGGVGTCYLIYKRKKERKLVEKLEADMAVWNEKHAHHREWLAEHREKMKKYGVQWDDAKCEQ